MPVDYSEVEFALEILNIEKSILNDVILEKKTSDIFYEGTTIILFYKDVAGLIHELIHLIVLRKMGSLRETNKDLFDAFSEFYASALSYLLGAEDVLLDLERILTDFREFLRKNKRNFAFSMLGRYLVGVLGDKLEPLFLKSVETAYKYFLEVLDKNKSAIPEISQIVNVSL